MKDGHIALKHIKMSKTYKRGENLEKIDFVITWVNGNDKNWAIQKAKYTGEDINRIIDNDNARYRDWELLKYWFRAVETNAPWVNKIYFVTCGQIPEWLNTENEKLVIMNHDMFIDGEYLPTFNSCAIEVNFNKIPGVSEQFVYFNDDMFINKPVKETDFFKNRIPVDSVILNPIQASPNATLGIRYKCMSVINSHFKFKDLKRSNLFSLKNGKYLYKNLTLSIYPFNPGIMSTHLPSSLLKSTFDTVWKQEEALLKEVSSHKLRQDNDVSQWLFQYWQIASNNVIVRKNSDGKYYDIESDLTNILDDVKRAKHKIICINDSEKVTDYENKRKKILEVFEKRYTFKSSFEK